MKKLLVILTLSFALALSVVHGQQRIVDSLKQVLYNSNNDTLNLVLYRGLNDAYREVNYDSAHLYAQRYFNASQKLGYKLDEAEALLHRAVNLLLLGSFPTALELSFQAQTILEGTQRAFKLLPYRYLTMLQVPNKLQSLSKYRLYLIGHLNYTLAIIYWGNASNNRVMPYALSLLDISKKLQTEDLEGSAYFLLGITSLNKPDSALYHLNKSYEIGFRLNNLKNGDIHDYMAKAYHEKGDHARELHYKRATLQFNLQKENLLSSGWSYLAIADYFKETRILDSILFYGYKALQVAQYVGDPSMEFFSSNLLADAYKVTNERDSAFKYVELMVAAKDKTLNQEKVRKFQDADYNQQLHNKAIQEARVQYRNRVRTYSLLAGLIVFTLLAIILWRNNLHRKKAYKVLQEQKVETEHQKAKTEQALIELKSTQAQLIQKEKMASLGELTAGIAHEIQNPLNFINNFSETNTELVGELQTELKAGNYSEAFSISKDLKEDEQKINHHGKRADSIVKGMLEHSRSSKGEKQLTDLNALVDEYLNLAYHGFRVKDKNFNAIIETYFEEGIKKVNIVPQDVGRVLLNLFNNAFFAVAEKKKKTGKGYEPRVFVSSKKVNDKVAITVKDNGMGISKSLIDKIFQPFFTTKPTGEGTGLGLSLSYDIVKAHGGELQVESTEGEGSSFIITIPTL